MRRVRIVELRGGEVTAILHEGDLQDGEELLFDCNLRGEYSKELVGHTANNILDAYLAGENHGRAQAMDCIEE